MRSTAFGSALAAAVFLSSPAAGRDLQDLARLLTSAYTAMNFAAVCAADPGWAGSQPSGVRGIAVHYAHHLKDDIVSRLYNEEAVLVLRAAADRARDEADVQLRRHVRASDSAAEAQRLRAWCIGYARNFIADFIRQDDHDHGEVHARIERAITGVLHGR